MRRACIAALSLALVGSCNEPTAPNVGCYRVTFYEGAAPDSAKPTKLLKLAEATVQTVDLANDVARLAVPSPNTSTSADWMLRGYWYARPGDSIHVTAGDNAFVGNNIHYDVGGYFSAEEAPKTYRGIARFIDGTGAIGWTSKVQFAPMACAD